jgi:hypothetical protein
MLQRCMNAGRKRGSKPSPRRAQHLPRHASPPAREPNHCIYMCQSIYFYHFSSMFIASVVVK